MKKYTYVASWENQTLNLVGEATAVLGDSKVSQVEVIIPSDFEVDPTAAVSRVYFRVPDDREKKNETLAVATQDENGDYHVMWTIRHAHTQTAGRVMFSLSLISGDDVQWNSRTATLPVYESQYKPESEEAEEPYTGRLTTLEGDMAEIRREFADVKSTATLGTPKAVATAAEMINDGKHTYIYTGTETGYTAGHVYYYVNGTLTDGGVYGGTAVDTTLTKSGQAADAAVVGAAIDEIKEDLSTKTGLSEEAKQALLACFAKVAWIDEHGQDYYDALEDALYPPVVLTSISAVYTQSGTVYDTDSLDSLKSDLVVTAHYSDGTSSAVTGYTLSGTLTEGTNTITVAYSGKTATFIVTVTAHPIIGWYYPFNDSIVSAGTEDFGFTGVTDYADGVNGQSYQRLVATEGDSTTDRGGIYATGISRIPDFSGDFTVSVWSKTTTRDRSQAITANKYEAGSITDANIINPVALLDGWTNTATGGAVSNGYKGLRITDYDGQMIVAIFTTTGKVIYGKFNRPSNFDTTTWHHFAICRKNGVLRVFIDGGVLFEVTVADTIYFPDQISIGSMFGSTAQTVSDITKTSYSKYLDDLYVAEVGKWDSAFDPAAIVY